ncbi:MAG: TraR/DksA C4-type zinc finger protein [Lewinellaceae bacterium]|nr:TraR/DksA C4-type zinc finger protein [Saprospiraceae bacterium]MCB9337906.1 TraR/DksA C4-type zinc finger protein [Lewinellaceae bacterium]
MTTTTERSRYSDQELEEFRSIIEKKLVKAQDQMEYCLRQLSDMADNPDAKVKNLDDGTGSAEREQLSIMATRQRSLINHLQNALVRVNNKAYGICRATGKLISKDRLRAVPHATLSIEAKRQGLA